MNTPLAPATPQTSSPPRPSGASIRAALRSVVRGTILTPADPAYAAAAQGWNLAVAQQPAVIVRALDAHDVQAAVRYASGQDLGVGVMATGHGIVVPCDGLLIDTSAMTGVSVQPATARVRVGAGVRWRDLTQALAPHRLTGLPGSSSETGVVGYTLGGGFGWLGRKFGLASHHLLAADLVTADGELRRVTPDCHPDLFWALGGGTGNFGVVTALEFRAQQLTTVYGGNLFYPLDRATDVLAFFAEWSTDLPVEMTAAATFRFFPPLPAVPDPLRGQRLIALRAVHCGNRGEATRLVQAARATLGPPVLDTFADLSPTQLPSISMDPVQPLAALSHAELLRSLDPPLIDALIALAGPAAMPAFVMLELRTLGGALTGSAGALSPMAHTSARYSLNAIGLSGTPQQEHALRHQLDALAAAVRPHATGDSYVNFLDSRMADADRIRAAYSPADWARLIALKHAYDPANLFRFNRNLG